MNIQEEAILDHARSRLQFILPKLNERDYG